MLIWIIFLFGVEMKKGGGSIQSHKKHLAPSIAMSCMVVRWHLFRSVCPNWLCPLGNF